MREYSVSLNTWAWQGGFWWRWVEVILRQHKRTPDLQGKTPFTGGPFFELDWGQPIVVSMSASGDYVSGLVRVPWGGRWSLIRTRSALMRTRPSAIILTA